ncbi:hypothetical protein JL721_9705 [Aureococcus anophagefferens]|nr:hypothetical protein JL721_9705 [Aureococcus anophagefferens]
MSLVDTAVVGRSASALELAALGPGTMVGDSLAYFCSFLSVATTNMIATARAEDDDPAPIFGTAVRLAVLCGLASAAAQIAGGRWVLTRYTAAESAAVVQPAYEYVRARACGAPFALLIKVEAACACFLLRRSRLPGGAARRLLPSRADVARFAVFAKPLLVTLAGKIATYSSLAHVATAVGVASTAAHRVLMPFGEVFSQVVARLRALAAPAAACVACLAPMCALEGALLATPQLSFLSAFYASNAAAMVAAFAAVERLGLGLGAAWCCMLAFQGVRLATFGFRLRRGVRSSETG